MNCSCRFQIGLEIIIRTIKNMRYMIVILMIMMIVIVILAVIIATDAIIAFMIEASAIIQ